MDAKIAMKLHSRIAHPTKEKLINYGNDPELIKQIYKLYKNCQISFEFKKSIFKQFLVFK